MFTSSLVLLQGLQLGRAEESCSDLDSLQSTSWHLHYVFNQTSQLLADRFTLR